MRCGIIEQLDMLSLTHRARYILTEITQDAIFSLYGLQPRPGGHLQRHPHLYHRLDAVQDFRILTSEAVSVARKEKYCQTKQLTYCHSFLPTYLLFHLDPMS